jgi:hypothetical protein
MRIFKKREVMKKIIFLGLIISLTEFSLMNCMPEQNVSKKNNLNILKK